MKPATIGVVVVSLFFASWMLTMANVLSQWTGVAVDISVDDLEAGRLTPLLFGPTLRQQYPSIPHSMSSMFDASALSCVTMGLAAVLFQLRSRMNSSWTTLAAAILLLGVSIFLAGAIVLRIGVQTPYEVASWLALMIYGLLYGAVMSLVLAFLDLIADLRARRSSDLSEGSTAISYDG